MTAKRFFTVVALALVLACGSASAQRHHHRPTTGRGHYHTTVTHRPQARPVHGCHAERAFDYRVGMAIEYLTRHATIDAARYARLTGLRVRDARKELRRMARSAGIPIVSVCGRHEIYALARCR